MSVTYLSLRIHLRGKGQCLRYSPNNGFGKLGTFGPERRCKDECVERVFPVKQAFSKLSSIGPYKAKAYQSGVEGGFGGLKVVMTLPTTESTLEPAAMMAVFMDVHHVFTL